MTTFSNNNNNVSNISCFFTFTADVVVSIAFGQQIMHKQKQTTTKLKQRNKDESYKYKQNKLFKWNKTLDIKMFLFMYICTYECMRICLKEYELSSTIVYECCGSLNKFVCEKSSSCIDVKVGVL